jgi:hypothetical protein
MAKKTPSSGKKASSPSNPKKPLNQPIPINSGTASSLSGPTSVQPEKTSRAQDHPGIEEEIRIRAYELYIERGCQHGFHNQDWSIAEVEVRSRHKQEKSA